MTKPVLVAGGDSFIFGSELSDQIKGVHSKKTYTSLLARENGMHYECVARPGASNSEIARHVVNYCETHKDIDKKVIVQWTFANRYEFNFVDIGWKSINVWNLQDADTIKEQLHNFSQKTIDDQTNTNKHLKTSGNYQFVNEFYKRVALTEFWEVYTSLKEIVFLQNYLKINNLPYLFTVADNSLLSNFTVDTKLVDIASLYNQINLDKFFMFTVGGNNHKGFYQWALENKYPVGATHPLEEAHEAASLLIKDRFNEMVKKHI